MAVTVWLSRTGDDPRPVARALLIRAAARMLNLPADAIEAYLVLAEGADVSAVERAITTRLAPFKRPRRLHIVEQLPRTATGKLVRNQAVLRDIGPGQVSAPRQEPGQAGDGAGARRPG